MEEQNPRRAEESQQPGKLKNIIYIMAVVNAPHIQLFRMQQIDSTVLTMRHMGKITIDHCRLHLNRLSAMSTSRLPIQRFLRQHFRRDQILPVRIFRQVILSKKWFFKTGAIQ